MGRFVWALVLASILAACGPKDDVGGSFAFVNDTATPLTIVYREPSGRELALASVAARTMGITYHFDVQACRQGTLLARGADGTEVAHLDGPFCPGGEWRVSASGAPSN